MRAREAEKERRCCVLCKRSGARLFDKEMRIGIGLRKYAEPENIGDDDRRIATAVDAKIGQLIGRETLRVQRAKAGFVAKQRTSGHGHATREQSLDRRIEPDDRNVLRTQKFRRTMLRIGASTQRQHDRFTKFKRAPERAAQLRRFEHAKRRFAMTLEEFRDARARRRFDQVVEIHKPPGKLPRQQCADSGLARAHEAGQCHNGSDGNTSHEGSLQLRRQSWKALRVLPAIRNQKSAIAALVALENADGTAERGKLNFGEAAAYGAEKPFGIARRGVADAV